MQSMVQYIMSSLDSSTVHEDPDHNDSFEESVSYFKLNQKHCNIKTLHLLAEISLKYFASN